MNNPIFSEFEETSSKAWKQKIQADLKGLDYNNTLIWKTDEGIDVKPFYHADAFKDLPNISNSKTTDWKICQTIEVLNTKEANLKAIDAINRGAESILFHINSEDISVENLVQNINLEKTPIEIKCNFLSEAFTNKVHNVVSNLNNNPQNTIILHTDIIGHLTKTGNWFNSLKDDHDKFESIVKKTNQLSIDINLYQNAGATNVQQLAYGLAHANEYLNHLDTVITSETKQSLKITYNVSIGPNYFFEIAKLRALRQLWTTLASEYTINTNCRIIAVPSKRNKTIYDYNVNMLRTTTECMSAILGGANVVCNLPYDALYHNSNEFGDRIARNQLLILKHESYFDKVNNPTDGTYYIENLTKQLAERALTLFKHIEANGGVLHQLKEGTIQRKIKESATKEQVAFDTGNLVLLGTNKYPNPKDKMKNTIKINPFLKFEKRKTLIEPILEKRLAEKLEINRLNEE